MYDLESFNPKSFISKLLGMGDISGLMETVSDMAMKPNSVDMIKKISAGEFSIRDMRSQFEMIAGMGPMSKIMGMIPGML